MTYHSYHSQTKRSVLLLIILCFSILWNAFHSLRPLFDMQFKAFELIKTVLFFHNPYSIFYMTNLLYLAFELHLEKVNNSGFNTWTERESYSSSLSRPWSPAVNCRQAMNQFLTLGSEICLWAVCHIRQRQLRRTSLKHTLL